MFGKNEFKEIGHSKEIVNVNHSITTKKGSIRGMHFQYPPNAEIKIVRCIKGTIHDVAVDIRKNSSTFLQYHSELLSADNMKMLYIPEAFAHGFQALDDNVEMIYFTTQVYSAEKEGGIKYDDPRVGIKWPLEVTEISKKDNEFKLLDDNFKGIEV